MARTFAYCPHCQTLWLDVPGRSIDCQHTTLDVTAPGGAILHREANIPVQVMTVARVYGDHREWPQSPEPVAIYPVSKDRWKP